jgi:cytoskeleton protein RodZ
VFEIGNSLREARLRQGLDLARVEDDTKVRAKYLQALEDERFEVLPAETYVKGFLRTYAEYLGLDGQLYVDEFSSRFASADEPVVASSPARRPRQRATESTLVVVALAGIVAVAVLFVVAFAYSNGDDPAATTPLGGGPTNAAVPPSAAPPPAAPQPAAARPRTIRIALAAARGDCWVTVRRGAPDGPILFSGTIFRGDTERFEARRIWLEFGDAPSENLNVRVNGGLVRNFPVGEPVVIVTPRGIRAQG